MNDIVFIKGQGGLARPLPGEDHISGMLFYSDNIPSGFATERTQLVLDLPSAIALGIVNDKTDETKATGGKVQITTPGAAADINTISVQGVIIGSYTVTTGDVNDDVATGLRAAINATTNVHGYIAAGTGADVTLIPPTGLGDSINGGTNIVFVSTGTGAATVTQFSGGVDSFFDVIYYHIKEFFRINAGATLYVHIADVPATTYDFTEVDTMQRAVNGKLRQILVYVANNEQMSTTHITAMQSVLTLLETDHMPLSAIYAADISSLSLTSLPDVRALIAQKVSVCVGQDGNADGYDLFLEKGYSITCAGAMLGAFSKASVHENIGWVLKFNMANIELDVPSFAEGTKVSSLSTSAKNSINNKGYIFLIKHIGNSGTYFNDSHVCIAANSDYAYIESNRTIDKATRNIRQYMLPQLNGAVYVDALGKLRPEDVKYLENLGNQALIEMEKAGELSGYKVVINPDQNIVTSSVLNISIVNIPVGVSRNIQIKIGYSNSI